MLAKCRIAPLFAPFLLVSICFFDLIRGGLAQQIQGTFSDFWNGSLDPNFPRHEGPFAARSVWNTVLLQSGFSGLDFYLDDYVGQPSSSVLVSTAVELNIIPRDLESRRIDGLTIV